MTRRLPLLDRIEIPAPCPAVWDSMTGDGVTRFCEQCSRSVHDLSSMTRRQAEGLVRRSSGRLCVRVMRDASGRTQTAGQPPRHEFRPSSTPAAAPLPDWVASPIVLQRASRTAAGALALALLATTPASAQAQSQTAASATQRSGVPSGTGRVGGVVTDPQGAIVVGATVTLTGSQGVATLATGADGRFSFDNMPPGSYQIAVEGYGFTSFEPPPFVISAGEAAEFDAVLHPESESSGMGGAVVMSVSAKAHCYIWKIKADSDAESEDPVEEAPEPPLLSAIDGGEDELREALDAGANANELFAFGRTPLMHAADDEDLVRLLLERGADPNLRDEGGATALHYAALADDAGTVFALCRAGGDPNIADTEGVTPLIIAALDGNEDAVAALLAAGANVHGREARGRSALDHAREEEHEEVIEILEVAGAR